MTPPLGRVLIIAGSDSGGGAGIQADIKTVTILGGYAATAVTAVTVQNTEGVSEVQAVPETVVAGQIQAVLGDIGADVIKVGMLGGPSLIAAVADALDAAGADVPVVVDPVMVAKGGARLLPDNAVEALKARLISGAAIVTPNAPEAEVLTGVTMTTPDDLAAAGAALLELGAKAALVKGGHIAGEEITDVLVTPDGVETFTDLRIPTRHTHGTGCTLASAIAAELARGQSLPDAIKRARAYVYVAIARAPGFGRGHGPLDHGWPLRQDAPTDPH